MTEHLIDYKEFQRIFYSLFEEMTGESLALKNITADSKLPFPKGNSVSAGEIWKVLKMRDVLEPIGDAGERELTPAHLFGSNIVDVDKTHRIVTRHVAFGLPESRLKEIVFWIKHYL